MVNDSNNIFRFNNFGDAKGGTEITVSQLLKYVDNDLLSKFDIIVSYPPKDFLRGEKPSLLWLHDLADDPYFEILRDKNYQEQFDYFIFVSYWQKESFRIKYGIPFEKCVVFRNAIDPVNIFDVKFLNLQKINITYTSTPQRGLIILFEVFKELKKLFKDKIELNVFSSFDLYGERHKPRNTPFLELFENLKKEEGVNYYGSVEHNNLIEKLTDQHIWCLPSIWQETSCISLLEAMSAKCIPVHSDLAVLPETSANFSVMYNFIPDMNKHAEILYYTLKDVIENIHSYDKILSNRKTYVDTFYDWKMRKVQWENFLNSFVTV